MTNFYFSGVNMVKWYEALKSCGACGMVNAVHLENKLERHILQDWSVPLVLDSGAYQGNTNIDAYIETIKRVGYRFQWVANLDVMGDQDQSNRNYTYIAARIPPEARTKLLWVYQYKAPLQCLLDGIEHHKHIGFGGLVPFVRTNALLEDLLTTAPLLDTNGTKVHYFGLSAYRLLSRVVHLPHFNSADSSTWLVGARFRSLVKPDGRQEKAPNTYTTNDAIRANIVTMSGWLPQKEAA